MLLLNYMKFYYKYKHKDIAVRQQAISWANADPDPCRLMTSQATVS